jgi:hypothetical protein
LTLVLNPNIVPIESEGYILRYRIGSLDVWGNEKDGFEVNDVHDLGSIEINEDWTNEQIIKSLVDNGYLNVDALDLAGVDSDGEGIVFINEKDTNRPVFNLWLE